jgi:predicted house-cleaning NTP pyrophosphatase (Maf/HAM1 superfamily)
MTEAGIKEELNIVFTQPAEHACIRGIQGLDIWLVEVVETNYYALVGLEAQINDRLNEAEEMPQSTT